MKIVDFDPVTDGDVLLAHIDSPYHCGRLKRPTHAAFMRNPLCGDSVRLTLRVGAGCSVLGVGEDADSGCKDVIQICKHEAAGCVLSQAGASILSKFVEGMTLAEARRIDAAAFLKLFGIPISPYRAKCALLAVQALMTTGPVAVGDPPDAPANDRQAA